MSEFKCVRCGRTEPRMTAPPLPNDKGNRVYDEICMTCWQDWLQHQTALINHYALNLSDPEARKYLTTQMEEYLFAAPKTEG